MALSTVHIFTPQENNWLLDYYKIISISRPILARANMGLDFVSGQYGMKYITVYYLQINTWAFPYWSGYHPEIPILARDAVEVQYGSRDDNHADMEMPMY
jgi:hypothetical protein